MSSAFAKSVYMAQAASVDTLCCSPGTVCFELLKGIPTALVALVVGLIAAGIAYRQYQLARAKLNLDLFDRRYVIFEKTWEYLSYQVQGGPPTSGFSSPFDNLVPQASFLFGPEVAEYMRTASSYMKELWVINTRTRARGEVMVPTDFPRHAELLEWFVNETHQGARTLFGKYLDFSKWR